MGFFGFAKSSQGSKPSTSRAAQFPFNSGLDRNQPSGSNYPSDQKSNPFNDPPPEYTPSDTYKPDSYKAFLHADVIESDLDVLRHYDTIFIVDDSGSMLLDDSDSDNAPKGKSKGAARTRWDKAQDALEHVVEMATKHDGNGVDIHFLNSPQSKLDCTDPKDVMYLFRQVNPWGKTPTGSVLQKLITPYIDSIIPWSQKVDLKSLPKPRNYIIITDGRPTDSSEYQLNNVISEFCRRLDEGGVPLTQLGIQFLQVGDADDASDALKELDGDLKGRVGKGQIRDIVDTIPFDHIQEDINESHIIKVLVGSINKRIDMTHHLDM